MFFVGADVADAACGVHSFSAGEAAVLKYEKATEEVLKRMVTESTE